jgi:hypothetical protein
MVGKTPSSGEIISPRKRRCVSVPTSDQIGLLALPMWASSLVDNIQLHTRFCKLRLVVLNLHLKYVVHHTSIRKRTTPTLRRLVYRTGHVTQDLSSKEYHDAVFHDRDVFGLDSQSRTQTRRSDSDADSHRATSAKNVRRHGTYLDKPARPHFSCAAYTK